MPKRNSVDIETGVFIALLLIFGEYAGFFIVKTSFVIEGVRYFSLFDDAMISMRYARNLAEGAGLVWNPGEHVEGYTNFLWTIMMSGPHLFPIPPRSISLFVQVISALLLLVNLIYVRKIALHVSQQSAPVSLGAVFLTAFYFPLNNWSLQGMEVGLLVALTAMMVWECLTHLDTKLPGRVFALMTLAILTRTEMVLLCGTLLGIHTFMRRGITRSVDWRGFVIIGAVVFGHTMFRLWYYGDPLPNTYYLKVVGIPFTTRLTRGVTTVWDFLTEGSILLFMLPFILLPALPRYRKQISLLMGTFAIQCAYSIYVGGDAWEWYGGSNRYIAIVMPMIFILIAWSLHTVLESVTFPLSIRRVNLKPVLFFFLTGYSFMLLNRQHRDELLLIARPLEVHNNERMVRQALLIDRCTTPDATVAVVWAGAIPYFTRRQSIDLLGKSDRVIAHLAPRLDETDTPGHNKWDYQYSIRRLEPDVVAQLWREPGVILPYMQQHYVTLTWDDRSALYFDKHSSRIYHDSLTIESVRVRL